MSEPSRSATQYQRLIEKTRVPPRPKNSAETELDMFLETLEERRRREVRTVAIPIQDPLQSLRELTINELVPAFVELVEKYSKAGIALHMDASNLLEGGREIQFEFGMGEYRTQLQGTVTSDAIAFHEVRHAPEVQGQLVAGPMLRLKQLNVRSFREFICSRLNVLLRHATRRR